DGQRGNALRDDRAGDTPPVLRARLELSLRRGTRLDGRRLRGLGAAERRALRRRRAGVDEPAVLRGRPAMTHENEQAMTQAYDRYYEHVVEQGHRRNAVYVLLKANSDWKLLSRLDLAGKRILNVGCSEP